MKQSFRPADPARGGSGQGAVFYPIVQLAFIGKSGFIQLNLARIAAQNLAKEISMQYPIDPQFPRTGPIGMSLVSSQAMSAGSSDQPTMSSSLRADIESAFVACRRDYLGLRGAIQKNNPSLPQSTPCTHTFAGFGVWG